MPIACSELSHLPSNNAVWTAPGKYTRPLHQSIIGLTCLSQFTPNTMSTSCRRCDSVKSIRVVTLAVVIGAPCTLPRERAVVPFPNSKKVSQGTQDNPAIVQHFCVTKHRVAPLSIKAENTLPLICTGTISNIPSDSTLDNFLLFFFFSFSLPIMIPVNLEFSLNSCDFSCVSSFSVDSVLTRPRCRQLCNVLNVTVCPEALPSVGFNCLSKRLMTSRCSLVRSRACCSFIRRRVRLL